MNCTSRCLFGDLTDAACAWFPVSSKLEARSLKIDPTHISSGDQGFQAEFWDAPELFRNMLLRKCQDWEEWRACRGHFVAHENWGLVASCLFGRSLSSACGRQQPVFFVEATCIMMFNVCSHIVQKTIITLNKGLPAIRVVPWLCYSLISSLKGMNSGCIYFSLLEFLPAWNQTKLKGKCNKITAHPLSQTKEDKLYV